MSIVEPEDVERAEGNAVHHMNERLIPPREKLSVRGGDKCVGGEDDSSIGMVLFSTVVSVCGSFEFGTCVGFSAPTEAEIKNDLDLSMAEYSFFGSILTVGAMVGAITSGRIADYVGRKRTMTLSTLFCIIGWLALFLSRSALMLDTGRLLAGYGTGILSYVVPIYIAEIAPKHLRGGLATLNQLMIVCGATVPFLIGTLVSWRTLTLTGLTPCFIMLIGLIFIPESPRWLANVGLHKEFTASLKTLRGKDADISLEASEIQDYIETLKLLPKSAILDLFQRSYIRPLTIAAGLMSLQQLGGINGIGFYASEIFVSAGFSSGKQGTIAYACVQVPITMISAILVDRSGRRPLLLVSATGTFFGCVLTATSFLLKSHGLWLQCVPFIAMAGVLLYISSFSVGMGAIPWVIMSEIFPLNVKGVAGSFVTLTGWLWAWLVSYTFNFLVSWSASGTFFVYAAFCALTVVFVAIVVPETKGKTLEKIRR